MQGENSVNGVIPNTERSFSKTEERVETMHSLPRTGKEIVRTAGKRTGRGGRNDRPLAFRLIEMMGAHPFPKSVCLSPSIFAIFDAGALDKIEILLHRVKFVDQSPVWQLCSAKNVYQSLYSGFPHTCPRCMWPAMVGHTVIMQNVDVKALLGDMAPQFFRNSNQHSHVVITLVNVGLGPIKVVVVGRLLSAIYATSIVAGNCERAISKEKAAELCHPSWVYEPSMNIADSIHAVIVAHTAVYYTLVKKVTDCHDLYSEMTSGIGTYPVPEGLTRETFESGFKGFVGGAEVYDDSNITIDSSDDAKGGVFAGGKGGAILLVQGRSPWKTDRDEPSLGGGGKSIWLWDEYGTGERSAGNWLKEVYSDAVAPTS